MKHTWVLITLFAVLALGGNQTYHYDSAGRLAQVTYANGKTLGYTYDATGNMLSRKVTMPCYDFPTFRSALPQWRMGNDIRDLITLTDCP